MGIMKYLELKEKDSLLQKKITDIQNDNAKLREDIIKISKDPFYIEKQAREDLGLAKPDEYIFRYEE